MFKNLKMTMFPTKVVRVLEVIGGGPGHEEALILLIGLVCGLLVVSILVVAMKKIGIDTGL